MFSKTFIEDEIEEDTSFFNPFQSILFLFSILVLSLVIFNLSIHFKGVTIRSFSNFCIYFGGIFGYIMLKWLLEYVFSLLFLIKKPIRFFLVSKSSYLYSVSFYLFIVIILVEYSQLNYNSLIYISIALFSIRFLLHIINNKKLIFSKLFYFILYLCAFEIAPLLILFKLMF